MHAYKEIYLNHAAKNLGSMLDYAVNDCALDGGTFLHMFVASGFAQQFQRGSPKVIAGMSGVEIASLTIETVTGEKPTAEPPKLDYRTPEYWAGWALAHYQWYSAMSFSAILRFLLKHYHSPHVQSYTHLSVQMQYIVKQLHNSV